MEARTTPTTRHIERPLELGLVETAGENILERFRQDLRDIGLDIELFENRMGNLLRTPLPRLTAPVWREAWRETGVAPLDLEDTGTSYQVCMNLPGVPKELVGIKFFDQTLEIEAETKSTKETERKSYVLRERKEAAYHRRIDFPTPVAPEKAEAKLDHGVLVVNVPKVKPAKELRVNVT